MSGTTLVLALGEPGLGDDGFGPLASAELQRAYQLDDAVILLDARAVGVRLLPLLTRVQHLLVLAALRLGAPAGTLHRLEWRAAPEALGLRLPRFRGDGVELLRQLDFWVDPVPELVVLGVDSEAAAAPSGGAGGGLTAPVARALSSIVEVAVEELRRWGHRVPARRVANESVAA